MDKEEIKREIRKYFETNKSNNKEQGQQIYNSNKYGKYYTTISIITLNTNDLNNNGEKTEIARANKKQDSTMSIYKKLALNINKDTYKLKVKRLRKIN